MRFTPFIAEIISDLAKGNLPKNQYKYYKDKEPPVEELMPKQNQKSLGPVHSVRKSRWREITEEEKKTVEEVPTSPRLIIFIAGGVTFSEIREVYDIAAKTQRDIFICSSHTLTAEGFLAELRPSAAML
jgi:syntaxin-binding protein 1